MITNFTSVSLARLAKEGEKGFSPLSSSFSRPWNKATPKRWKLITIGAEDQHHLTIIDDKWLYILINIVATTKTK